MSGGVRRLAMHRHMSEGCIQGAPLIRALRCGNSAVVIKPYCEATPESWGLLSADARIWTAP